MTQVRLISCGARKLDHAVPAKDLYCSPNFRLARRWAEQGDAWYILSAKHGLVHPETVIEPYNLTIDKASRDWGARVLAALPAGDLDIVAAVPGGYLRPLLVDPRVRCAWGDQRPKLGQMLRWFKEHTQ